MPLAKRIMVDDRSKSSETALDEALALLSLLDPAEAPEDTHTSSRPNQSITKLGKRFLDHLSWLCDPLPRGKTVAAIGVQESRNGCKFWIASNNGCRSPVKRHLKWLLEILGQLVDGHMTINAVQHAIFEESIALGSQRVNNYIAQLVKVESHCSRLEQTCDRGKCPPLIDAAK